MFNKTPGREKREKLEETLLEEYQMFEGGSGKVYHVDTSLSLFRNDTICLHVVVSESKRLNS